MDFSDDEEQVWERVTNLKGTVVEINLIYQSFTLGPPENGPQVPVFVGNCDNLLHFPRIGDEITITEALSFNNQQFYLEGPSQIVTEAPLGPQSSRFTFIVQRNKITAKQLQQFHFNFPEVDLSAITSHSRENVKLNTLEMVLRKGQFRVPKLATTTNLLYVTLGKIYRNFPYFSHGVHHNLPDQFLIGKIVPNKTGQIILTDGVTYQQLIVVCAKRMDLFKFANKIVYLDKFIVFTEVYESGENQQYVYCEIRNVHLFGAPVNSKIDFSWVQRFNKTIETEMIVEIVIVSLATPSQRVSLDGQCRLEVLMRISGQDWKTSFLCLHADSLLIVPFLDVGMSYRLFLTRPLKESVDGELLRLTPRRPVYEIPPNSATFLPDPSIQSPYQQPPILDFSRILSVMKNLPYKGTTNVNFEGVLYVKGFSNQDGYTRTPAYSSSIHYGTPGSKTQLLRFEDASGKTREHFTIYLNNWERQCRPVGLLSNVRLRIYNVDVAKNYAKVTALTRVEIVGYESLVQFNSANLNSMSDVVFWASVGEGACVPYRVLIRAKATIGRCKKFHIRYEDGTVRPQFSFLMYDGRGHAEVHGYCLDLFKRIVFDNDKVLYRVWLDWFRHVKYYSFYGVPNDPMTVELEKRYYEFHDLVRLKLSCSYDIEMMCRRKEPNRSEQNDCAVWVATEIHDIKKRQF